jgi:hypothetical protein
LAELRRRTKTPARSPRLPYLGFRQSFAYPDPMTSQDAGHRVYMSFQDRYGWHCQFLEQDLKTSLPRKLHFKSAEKVIELVARGGGLGNLERKQMLDQAIEMGRGGVFLSLTPEQYAELLHN